MTVRQLEEMVFFELKLLADKEGILYVRDGEVFIYQGSTKIEIENDQPALVDTFGLGESLREALPGSNHDTVMIADKVIKKLETNKDVKRKGYFWFWQSDEYFVLGFVTEASKQDDGVVYLLRAGRRWRIYNV